MESGKRGKESEGEVREGRRSHKGEGRGIKGRKMEGSVWECVT